MPAMTHTPEQQSESDLRFMRLAIELAREAALVGEVPVGAVIHREGDLLASAHNRREIEQNPVAHAEMIAIQIAALKTGSWRLERCTLVVTLEPCAMCAGALVNARVPRLVYGAADPKMGCVHTLHQLCTDTRFNHRLDVTPGVLAEECGTMLSEFFRQRRRKS